MGLSLVEKVAYGVGFIPLMLQLISINGHLQFVYADAFKLPADMTGYAWTMYSIAQAVTFPTIGFLSDRAPGAAAGADGSPAAADAPASRRRRVMLLAFLPWLLAWYFLWNPPAAALADSTSLFVYVSALLLVDALLQPVMLLNWVSLFGLFFPSTAERASGIVWKMLFTIVGLICGMAVPPALCGHGWPHRGRMAYMSALSATLMVFAWGATAGVVSRIDAEAAKSAASSRSGKAAGKEAGEATGGDDFVVSFLSTLRNRTNMTLLAGLFLIQLGNNLMGSTFQMYGKYVYRVGTEDIGGGVMLDPAAQASISLLSFYVAAIAAAGLWTRVATALGPIRTISLECVVYGLSVLLYVMPAPNFWIRTAVTFLNGCALSGFLSLPDIALETVIDEEESLTGTRRQGIYHGVRGVMQKLAAATQGIVVGKTLSAYGYDATFEVQGDGAVFALKVLMVFVPAALIVAAAGVLTLFPLQGASLDAMLARLKATRARLRGESGNNDAENKKGK